jgi:ArsR family transcriptional regulator
MTELAEESFYERHAELCHSFSNGNRLKILDILRGDVERTVSDITDASDVPQPTVSQHLKVLRDQGIVERRRDGVEAYYSLTDQRIFEAIDLMRGMTRERAEE